MKLRTFILVLAAMASMAASAQTVRGSNGLSKGKIDSDGTVRGSNGLSVGKIGEAATACRWERLKATAP